MDPQQTWTDMLDALKQNDHQEAKELAEALLDWLRKGGFPPIVVGDESLGADWHRTITAFICRSVVSRTNETWEEPHRRTPATNLKGDY